MNTLENKAKFFAQYWGQSVGINQLKHLGGIATVTIDSFHISRVDCLELTSLSQITDEDAIEVAMIVTPVIFERSGKVFITRDSEEVQVRQKLNVYLTVIEFIEGAIYAYSEDESYTHNPNMVYAIDFLRSKGYALPWMGVSVEQQVEYGWIKLKG